MKYLFSILLIFTALLQISSAQSEFSVNWQGEVKEADAFSFKLKLSLSSEAQLHISNAYWSKVARLKEIEHGRLKADFGEGLYAEVKKSKQGYRLFIKSGVLFYHIPLKKEEKDRYSGKWDIWMTSLLSPMQTYLVYEQGENDKALYPFFQDGRFTGTWAANYRWEGNKVSFQDMKTGLSFRGEIQKENIHLEFHLAGEKLTEIDYRPMAESFTTGNRADQKPGKPLYKDHWGEKESAISSGHLDKMENEIYAGELPNTHAVLMAQEGKLLYENYFYGHNADIFHDQRSASKSLTSAMIGIAIKEGLLQGVEQKLYDFVPEEYQYTRTDAKGEIDIHALLSMASGLDAIDFGIDRNSAASEGTYQNSPNWIKTVLEAPMINASGAKAYYGTANPYLLGIILEQLVDLPLEWYMDEKLFEPLGISQYVIQSDERGIPYFGGGVYLRPRDMLSFGQLYLNEGKWGNTEILPEGWTERSFQKYGPLLNANNKNQYGYLFWHREYEVGGKSYASIEARGAGGQYIAVIPQLEVVIAIASGNYRNGRFMLPEQIIEDYLLPAVLEQMKD
ncbi:MAG: serine hydrolase [Bacteroidia bacterium]|nr:serine hydrolase [Bacteroidia bacterium]